MSKTVVVWLLLSLIWGSTWLFIKLGLQDLPPFTFAGVRFVIAASILLCVIAARRVPLPRAGRDWLLIALTGVMAFSVNYGLLFWGEQRTSSGLAAILQTIIPAFGLIIAHYYLPDERITLWKVCGIALGIAGVALIFSDQASVEDGKSALAGSAAIVVGAFGVAYSNVLVKARARHIEPAALAAGQMVFGLVPLLLAGVLFEGNPFTFRWSPLAVLSLLYLALVGSAIAFLMFYWLVRNMDVTKTMLIPLVTPPIAVFLGWLVLGEGLTWRTAVGALGIMSGIALIVTRKKKELQAATTTATAGAVAPVKECETS
ncbi:MAG TPA: EamA family transporter [Pyrinomonadaceae bacterium]|jgi:drug/metabolite transporter (DMT)-like permease|nr:EamA family transporter [Pyrinomonadaceae bacterium]